MAKKDWLQYRVESSPSKSNKKDWMKYSVDNSQDSTIQKQEPNQSFLQKIPIDVFKGLFNLSRNIVNSPHNIANALSPNLGNKIPEFIPKSVNLLGMDIPVPEPEPFGRIKNEKPIDKLIQQSAEIAPSFFLPELQLGRAGKVIETIPKVGKFLKKSIGTAIPAGLYTALQSENEPLKSGSKAAATTVPFSAASSLVTANNPWLKLAGKIGAAGSGGYLGSQLGSGLGGGAIGSDIGSVLGAGLGLVGVNPKISARRDMLKGVEGTDYQDKLEAAKRLGLTYLTPAEASGNPFLGGKQGNIGKTSEGAKLLYNKGEERLQSEEKSIGNLLHTVFNKEELSPKVNKLYEESRSKEIPEKFITKLNDNEIVKRAERVVNNKPAYKESLKNVPRNTIEYWDHIKQAMDDMIEKAPEKEGRLIKQTRKDLLNTIDEIHPVYKEARQLAEREITRRKLQEVFNQKRMIGTNFYKKLENKQYYDKLQKSLRNVPEAQQAVKDMKLVFKDLINAPTVRTAAGLAKTSMTNERSSTQALINKGKELFTGGKYDKAAIELITNPKWRDELHKINELSNFEKKLAKTFELLGRVASTKAINNKEK